MEQSPALKTIARIRCGFPTKFGIPRQSGLVQELNAQINIMKSQYVNTKKLETELYQRLTIPMASLIFTLVGVPLGMQPNRNSSSMGFVMSILIIFVYYSLMTMAGAIAQGGMVPPVLAVWIPNIIGIAAGGYLMHRMAK